MENGSMVNHGNSPAQRVIAIIERMIVERSIPNGRSIQSDHTLVEIGLTSMDLARLVLLIEDEFDLRIPVRDLIPTNFRSISTINQLVSKLLPAKS
jgi:acyl carrier protein